MKQMTLYLLLATLLFVTSCANIESGHYVMLSRKDTVTSLAKEFKVAKWRIKEANQGKKFRSGEWVFIPLKRGILGHKQRGPQTYATLSDIGEFIWPVPGSKRISSPFGKRWGKMHQGIDISGRIGLHIVASNDGVVVYSGNAYNGYGNIIVLAHRYGYFSIYAHNKKNYVDKGQKVYKGEVIALLGQSGRSTGPHVHFEVRKNSKSINPLAVISKSSKYHVAKR